MTACRPCHSRSSPVVSNSDLWSRSVNAKDVGRQVIMGLNGAGYSRPSRRRRRHLLISKDSSALPMRVYQTHLVTVH